MRGRVLPPLVVAVLAALATLFVSAGPASAHAALEGVDPRDGTVLGASPPSIRLEFNEPISLQPRGIRVFHGDGAPVPVSASAKDKAATIHFDRDLPHGTYIVSWRVNSADGHAISGAFNFSVMRTSEISFTPSDPKPTPALTTLLQVANGIGYLGLLTATGLALFSAFLVPASLTSMVRTRQRLLRLSIWGAAAAAVASAALIPLQAVWQTGGSVADLVAADSWAGLRSIGAVAPPLMVVLGLVLVLLGHRAIVRADRGSRSSELIVTGTLLALSSLVVTGHTRSYGPLWVSLPIDLIHVVAAALWFGALLGIVVACLRSSQARALDVVAAVSRFSGVAVDTILVLSVAGVVLALLIMDSVDTLLDSAWGVTFVVKVGLVALVLGLAGANRYLLLPRISQEAEETAAWVKLRRLLRVEALALVAVIAVTGVLVTRSPVIPAAATPAPAPQTVTKEFPVTGGTVKVALNPVKRGVNTVTVTIVNSSGAPLAPASPPRLQTSYQDLGLGPFDAELVRVGPGSYTASVDMGFTGRWSLDLTVRVGKYTSAKPQFLVDIP